MKKAVELHSRDFEWEELARVCRQQIESSSSCNGDAPADSSDGDAQDEAQLAQVAKLKWEVFHQKNNGTQHSTCVLLLAAELISSITCCRLCMLTHIMCTVWYDRQGLQAAQLLGEGVPRAPDHGTPSAPGITPLLVSL